MKSTLRVLGGDSILLAQRWSPALGTGTTEGGNTEKPLMALESHRSGLKAQLFCFLAVSPWEISLASLSLSFPYL